MVQAVSCEKDTDGRVTVVHVVAVPNSVGATIEGHKPKGVIHWVDANNCYRGKVNLYENLFNVPNPGAAEDFLSTVNKNSKIEIENAALEASLKNAKVGQSFQFEREGYFCVDSKNSTEDKPEFNLTVALRETKKVSV